MSEAAIRVESPVAGPHPLRGPDLARCWAERLQRFSTAKLSIVAFCAAEGVSKATFFLWRRRLALAPTAHNTHTTSDNTTALVPIHITPTHNTPIEIAFPSGTLVRFPADTQPEVIVAVLRGLEDRSC
jgi:hypothetical protein